MDNRVYAYLRLSFEVRMLATYLIYYRLYFLSICLLQLKYDQWNYYCYMIICCTIRSRIVTCSTIRGCTANKNYYYTNIVCIHIVPQWGTNWEYGINRGNILLITQSHSFVARTSSSITHTTPTFIIEALYLVTYI